MLPRGCRGNDDGCDGRRREGGSGALVGVLTGLGSGMVRGPYAGWQLGQASPLPAMCTSGPLALLDAGPEPGRWVKPRSRPDPPTGRRSSLLAPALSSEGARRCRRAERAGGRSGSATGAAARPAERQRSREP